LNDFPLKATPKIADMAENVYKRDVNVVEKDLECYHE